MRFIRGKEGHLANSCNNARDNKNLFTVALITRKGFI